MIFDGTPYRDEFKRRIETIWRLLDSVDSVPPPATDVNIGREMRGLVIVLLFASYENLIKALCRGLLETAKSLGVGNRRLRPGFRLFTIYGHLTSISDQKRKETLESVGIKLLEEAFDSRNRSINPNVFPSDGSFMKRSQILLFCDLFDLGDPGPILREVWDRLDTIVVERNKVAHGGATPEEIGRGYTPEDTRRLVQLWDERWTSFIDDIVAKAASREFFRK